MDTVFRVTDGVLEQYDGCSETVVIPDGIVVIGSGAFQDNKTITEVIMPDTVRAIRHDAFASCVKLKSVVFSKTLQTIDYNAFWGCKSLKSLELPDTLRALGSSVFAGCSKLTSLKCESEVFEVGSDPFTDYRCPASGSQLADEHGFLIFCGVLYAYYGTERDIVIPDGVKKIMNDVFRQNAYALVKKAEITSAVIPDSVTYIGNLAFKGCRTLRSVRMPEQVRLGTHVFAGCDGLANPDGFVICGGIACEFFGPGPHVHVTEGVRELSAEVFANRSIHTVSLPDSLVRIGDCAFEGCNLLERIVIPDSVKEIGSGAFRGCYHLSEVTLPDTVETMGDGVFAGCRGLAGENGFVIRNRALHAYFGSEPEIVVPEGVTGIASGVFYKSDVVSVQLPSTLKTLGSAFSQCRRLTEIVIPEGVTKICNGTFSGCDQLTRVVLPESLTQIGSDAFHGCSALREIRIPDGVTSIGSQAFADCEALSEITIPKGVKLLNYRIFNSCTALKTVRLPDGLRAIDSEAFRGCTGLETLTIPDTVEKYGLSVFARCSSLKSLHCTIRGTVEGNPFEDCAGLVDADGYTVVGGILWKCINGKEHAVIPEGVTAIARDVFREGRIGSYKFAQIKRAQGTLKSVTFPSTLQQIYEGAFEGCKALEQITLPEGLVMLGEESFCDCTALKEIVVPDRVEKIGKSAFSGCTALQRIHLPAGVADLSADLFRGCESLVAIEVDADNPRYSSRDGMLFNKAADTLLCVPGGLKLKEFTVPQGVSAIGNRALIDCTELRKVVIPETVKRIGFEVFVRVPPVGRVRLSEIEVAPNAGSEEIGSNVFDFQDCDRPLVYPRLPVTFVKEPLTQIALALGFCMHPERYEGVYAEGYRKFALSHQKTLMKKAQLLKLKEVEAYFASVPGAKAASADGGYRPDLSVKKPSDLRKVEILEETVRKGTLEDLNAVLKTYKPFEMTARALGLAARYRGIDFVRALVAQGAKFRYEDSPAMIRKYAMQQKTVSGCYNTDYALMLVPEHLFLREHTERGDNWYEYEYTPLCGVKAMCIPDELEARVLPMEQRVEIAVYLDGRKNLGASADEMLFWALTKNELAFADALIERGVDLQKTPPTYYRWSSAPSYLEIITTGKSSVYWTNYTTDLSKLEEKQLLPVLERLCALAARAQKKPVLSQKMYDDLHWNDASLSFALQNFDVSKVNQKKALEAAILNNASPSCRGWRTPAGCRRRRSANR